jgi:DNA-binding CsgD family transcriptional regulator
VVGLSARDVSAVVNLQEEVARLPHGEPFVTDVLDALARLVPAEAASFCELDHAERRLVAQVDNSNHPEAEFAFEDDYWRTFWDSPMSRYHVASRGAAVKISDFFTPRQLARRPEILAKFGLDVRWDVIGIDITDDRRRTRKFLLARRGIFSERDRTILDLLKAPFRLRYSAAVRTGSMALLTARERQVMALVAVGCANKEIASQLLVSPATVGKHLEHVYDKLSVENRTAAVARLGLIPGTQA